MVDDNLEEIDFDKIKRLKINLAAITSMTMFVPRAYEIAGELRKRGIKIILGGPHATLCPDEARKHVAAVVVGEAERRESYEFSNDCVTVFRKRQSGKRSRLRFRCYPLAHYSVQALEAAHNWDSAVTFYTVASSGKTIDDVLARVRKSMPRAMFPG
jgi:hypothetical protein